MRRLILALAVTGAALAQVYTFDPAGRLTHVLYSEGGGVRYQWDDGDNLLLAAPLQVPPAPSGVDVSRVSPTSARVSWGETAGAISYRIERRAVGETAWQVVATVGGGARSFLDESLTPGQEYVYRVSGLGPDGAGLSSEEVTTELLGPPLISEGGILNGASFQDVQGVAAGSIISIFGRNFGVRVEDGKLSTLTAAAPGPPLPLELAGHSVLIQGRPAPLFFVSGRQVEDGGIGGQINVQVPWQTAAGDVPVVVRRRDGSSLVESAPRMVRVTPAAPAIFTFAGGGGAAAVVNHPEGSIAQPEGSIPGAATKPAARGGVITVYLTGLGAVNPPVRDGEDSLDALRTAVAAPRLLIGGQEADVSFAGLSPEFVGLYQINAVVPAESAIGDQVPIRVESGSVLSREDVTIAVGP